MILSDKKHVISLLVSNKPGVLIRIALVFFCLGYNIDSLVVSEETGRISVACNGVCLTVEKWLPAGPEFTAFASAETASCTNLGGLRVGALVNIFVLSQLLLLLLEFMGTRFSMV